MRHRSRLPSVLFVALVVLSWGPCPCLLTGSFAREAAPSAAAAGTAHTVGKPRCCCHDEAQDERRPDAPADGDDCPCCRTVGSGRVAYVAESGARPVVLPLVAVLDASSPSANEPAPSVLERPVREDTLGPPAERRRGVELLL